MKNILLLAAIPVGRVKKSLFLLAALPLLALAQGSGSIATPPSVSGSVGAPFRVTKAVTGVVQSIDEKSIAIVDAKTRKVVDLVLVPGKMRVSGAGTKKVADVTKGATVRINYAVDDRRALDIRVIATGER